MPTFLIAESSSHCGDSPQRVRLVQAQTLQEALDGVDYPTRVSPLFRLRDDAEIEAGLPEQCVLLFLAFDRPFQSLARIHDRAAHGVGMRTWFSLGHMSCVVIRPVGEADDPAEGAISDPWAGEFSAGKGGGSFVEAAVGDVVAAVGKAPLSQEAWRVDRGLLVATDWQKASYSLAGVPALSDYAALPPDIRPVVDETLGNLRLALAFARAERSDEVAALLGLWDSVDVMVSQLIGLLASSAEERDLLIADLGLAEPDSETMLPQLVHQRVDQLVQINSLLAYNSSQAHEGCAPMLEGFAPIRRHSLLGVGTAHRGLSKIVRGIENAFNVYRLEQILTSAGFANGQPLPGFFGRSEWDSKKWHQVVNVDRALPGTAAQLPPALTRTGKLTYFSGRLGFRESQYGASAALQTLHSGDDLEWHLGTMTHEMLHSHVRHLLASIFEGDPTSPQDSEFERHYTTFQAQIDSPTEAVGHTLESVRNLVFSYLTLVPQFGSLTRRPGSDFDPATAADLGSGFRRWPVEYLRGLLEGEYRNISEIMVHVLDLHYFYDEDVPTYIEAVWTSWSVVPGVIHDTRQYLLRSLLAIASTLEGDVWDRFEQAGGTLLSVLESVEALPHAQGLIDHVVGLIDPESPKYLLRDLTQPFWVCLRLADLAKKVLFSPRTKAALYAREELATYEDGENGRLTYLLEEGRFSDIAVTSPTFFLKWRLQTAISRESVVSSEERAAWALLVASSAEIPTVQQLREALDE